MKKSATIISLILTLFFPLATLASPSISILEPLSPQSTKYVDKYF